MNKIPFIKDDFGIDFSVHAFNDLQISSVRIEDSFGEFIPVHFQIWDKVVNNMYVPLVMQQYPNLNYKSAYEQAIVCYCTQYAYNYICLN